MKDKKNIWFPAKKYGYGWGLPITWQGWVVLTVYIALTFLGVYYITPETKTIPFIIYNIVMTFIFIFFCWFKGEETKWRWGNKNN